MCVFDDGHCECIVSNLQYSRETFEVNFPKDLYGSPEVTFFSHDTFYAKFTNGNHHMFDCFCSLGFTGKKYWFLKLGHHQRQVKLL